MSTIQARLEPAPQTFLFADLAGFIALTKAIGDERAADLAAAASDAQPSSEGPRTPAQVLRAHPEPAGDLRMAARMSAPMD